MKKHSLYFFVISFFLLVRCMENKTHPAAYSMFPPHIPSKIDSITTPEEVERIINTLYDTLYPSSFKCLIPSEIRQFDGNFNRKCLSLAKGLTINRSFQKADFDRNGYTDLLSIGKKQEFLNISVVMNYGNDSLRLIELTPTPFSRCALPFIDTIENHPVIRYFQWKTYETKNGYEEKLTEDTLVFKFGGFIEYNPHPARYTITEIDLQTGICNGYCPVFHLKINENREAVLEAEAFNINRKTGKEIKGIYKTNISEKDYEQLVNLLNYIDFLNLRDHYYVTRTDAQSINLSITYRDQEGQERQKRIFDYGKAGTFGLIRLYEILFALRFTQNWTKTAEL